MVTLECKIREHDNIVVVEGSRYHFKRMGLDKSTPMLCNVIDHGHAESILGMGPEFSLYEPDAQAAGPQAEVTPPPVEPPVDEQPTGDDELGMLTLDELRERFKAKTGREPHPLAKPETLLARLREQ